MLKALLLFLAIGCSSAQDINIKKYLKICDRSSPEINECLTEAVQEALSGVMADGIKELGVPAVDPYYQKEIRIEYKNNQIAVKMTMKDIYVAGLKTSTVHDVRLRADEDRFSIEVDLTSPKTTVKGIYHGEGGWNSIQINTTGSFNTTMRDLVYTWKITGKPVKIDGKTHIKVDSFYMRPDLGDMKTFMTSDNPEFREIINLGNDFANANWKALYREFLPYAQDNWNRIGIRVCNKLFMKVPADQLFPSS